MADAGCERCEIRAFRRTLVTVMLTMALTMGYAIGVMTQALGVPPVWFGPFIMILMAVSAWRNHRSRMTHSRANDESPE